MPKPGSFVQSDFEYYLPKMVSIHLGENGKFNVLQKTFLEHAALQCGICTPGMLVAAKSLLEKNTNPTETEIRYWLAGNLCRCTGYDKIVKAVQAAAEEIRENA